MALLLWINNSEHLTKSKYCLVKSQQVKESKFLGSSPTEVVFEPKNFKNHYFCATPKAQACLQRSPSHVDPWWLYHFHTVWPLLESICQGCESREVVLKLHLHTKYATFT